MCPKRSHANGVSEPFHDRVHIERPVIMGKLRRLVFTVGEPRPSKSCSRIVRPSASLNILLRSDAVVVLLIACLN